MTDKSFGDYASKNSLKNPLLSTAVTGLSLADLTQNAVLLPVVQTQELIAAQDQQTVTQACDLTKPEYETINSPSGDANAKNVALNYSHTEINNILGNQQNIRDVTTNELCGSTLSKASAKSGDDFDVDEYFARLQGTRYVSAPLYSHLKEDQNANLEATEENLEEINLNEPDKSQNSQQSITADIAQNFSQLPTVLPQVASAVFNSFSNMLSLKSREHTPDSVPSSGHQELHPQRPQDETIPLIGVGASEEVKEVAPPPKEPPISAGVGNYRITTKKKAYAQIPGLNSTIVTQDTLYNTPPTLGNLASVLPSSHAPPSGETLNIVGFRNTQHYNEQKRPADNIGITYDSNLDKNNPNSFNLFNPTTSNPYEVVPAVQESVTSSFVAQSDSKDNRIDISASQTILQPYDLGQDTTPASMNTTLLQGPAAPIIPPPPMFSNLPKRESQVATIGRTILPPSVARRKSANHPMIKTQVQPNPILSVQNIFTPAPVQNIYGENNALESTGNEPFGVTNHPSAHSTLTHSEIAENTFVSHTSLSTDLTTYGTQQDLQATKEFESSFAVTEQQQMNEYSGSGVLTFTTTSITTPQAITVPFFHTNPGIETVTTSAGEVYRFSTIENIVQNSQVPHPETVKLPPEPPKLASGNINFRMGKKRPQYYSGPIAGVGEISNNEKPIITPVSTETFQGTVFIPQEQKDNSVSSTDIVVSQIDHSTVPFITNKLFEQEMSYGPFDSNKPQENILKQYNTAFDLRDHTESYESHSQESRSFGIIGSLKSKLSSIDINKLQNSVTTFFDPAYNDVIKQDKTENYPPFDNEQNTEFSNIHGSSNFEIFVPQVEQHHDYQRFQSAENHNWFHNYNEGNQNQNVYNSQNQEYTSFPPPYSYPNVEYNAFAHQGLAKDDFTTSHQSQASDVPLNLPEEQPAEIHHCLSSTHTKTIDDNVTEKLAIRPAAQMQILNSALDGICSPSDLTTYNVFDNRHVEVPSLMSSGASVVESAIELNRSDIYSDTAALSSNLSSSQQTECGIKNNTFILFEKSKENIEEKYSPPESNPANNVPNSLHEQSDNLLQNINRVSAETSKEHVCENKISTASFSVPFFDLATLNQTQKSVNTKTEDGFKESQSVAKLDSDVHYFDKNKFINTTILDPQESSTATELNICETCREVNKHETIECDGLTAQLIENITSPILLSNAVEVPLPESDTPLEDRAAFDSNQCAEISQITEETFETMFVQSATELLDKIPNANNYGWCTNNSNALPLKDILDPNYSFKLQTDSIPYVDNTSLLFNNVPNNASDEIKAEFKNQEDLVILPKEMSVPTAPPEEFDETKSDETGILDVQSIEQDAKKDYPFFEEFVIEPSETDDDKIEIKERKRSSEDSTSEKDTFTNRIEKFKKMEESCVDASQKIQLFELTDTNSSVIPIASYFDTGNYAAESHYRNSITSSLTLSSFDASNAPTRIPPGFEDEFHRKLSIDVTKEASAFKDKDHDETVPFIPETTTQTKFVESVIYSPAPILDNENKVTELEQIYQEDTQQTLVQEINKIIDEDINVITSELIAEQNLDEKLQATSTQFDSHPNIGLSSSYFKNWLSEENITQITDRVFGKTHDTVQGQITSINQTDKEPVKFVPKTQLLFGTDQSQFSKGEQIHTDKALEVSNSKHSTQNLKEGHTVLEDKQILPDPINFFTSNVEASSSQDSSETDGSFNRLASYFTSPPKTDHAKSFFELSQSQDHYRHKDNLNDNTSRTVSSLDHKENAAGKDINIKSFFELSQGEDQRPNLDRNNIPQDKYLASLDLMQDLTSYQNYNPKDQIVRTVNYFTVEYDNDILNNLTILNKTKSDYDREIENIFDDNDVTTSRDVIRNLELEEVKKLDSEMQVNAIQYCVYCCNIDTGRVVNISDIVSDIRLEKNTVRKSMDGKSSESVKDKRKAMDDDKSAGNRKSTSVNFSRVSLEDDTSDDVSLASETRSTTEYTPVKYHWFYRVDYEGKSNWRGFSTADSAALETAFNSPDLNEKTVVATDGGRFDVNVVGRLRVAVYWCDKPTNVRRCSWFYKGTTDVRYVPYTEEMAERLEEEYRHGITTGEWHRRLVLNNSELVVMHGPQVIVHFLQGATNDAFSSPNQAAMRPRVVRRGFDESEIEETEPSGIDHLLLLCHGVGSACDMKFRSVEEVVDDFRATSLQLIQSHYRNSYSDGQVHRVEVLPISWHSTLHSGEAGVDRRLAQVTLESIPRLRNFTNDTVLDVLFYTSPIYSQTIVDTVCSELNRIYNLFKTRNPKFTGGVSVGGHSLGSVILYDLLCHQDPDRHGRRPSSQEKEYVSVSARLGQPNIIYPSLSFCPDAMYALGSPIAIFECIRGVENLGANFSLPTCKNFFNIFHPFDPIAYRIEPLINPELKEVKPFLIPHHKGRKRMHLELKDTMARVGADLKQRLLESLKATWDSVWGTQPPSGQLEKVVEEEVEKQAFTENSKEETPQKTETVVSSAMLGKLNAGRRVDYVLQEAPLEMINEYLFAMSSHVCYWESEDTMLMMLREIYDALGIQPDSTVPQQSLTVQRSKPGDDDSSETPSSSRNATL